jgi:hypothetical protein
VALQVACDLLIEARVIPRAEYVEQDDFERTD